jgi:hypothetical protein
VGSAFLGSWRLAIDLAHQVEQSLEVTELVVENSMVKTVQRDVWGTRIDLRAMEASGASPG